MEGDEDDSQSSSMAEDYSRSNTNQEDIDCSSDCYSDYIDLKAQYIEQLKLLIEKDNKK